jgi:hypothetical protein
MPAKHFLGPFAILILVLFSSCKKSDSSPEQPKEPEPVLHTITSFSPLTGPEGTEVIITGTNFSTNGTNNIVSFNGIVATVSKASATQLTVTVPTGATTGKITVTKGNDKATSAENFTVKTSAKKLLKRILIFQYDSEIIDVVWEWQYDALKRVTEATTIRQLPSPSVNSKARFYYTANETKPYFIQALPQVASENTGVDTYITYGADGRKVKDSSFYIHLGCGKTLYLANYSYTNNMINVQYHVNIVEPYMCTSGPAITYNDTIYLGSDNVTKVVQAGDRNPNFRNSILYTYDSKINPFQQLNVFSSFYTLGFDVGFRYWNMWSAASEALYIIGLNKNNVSSIQLNGGSYTQQFTYIYDSDDYPSSVVITTNNVVSTWVTKVKYEYVQ